MVFIANQEHAFAFTQGPHTIFQALNSSPRCAEIHRYGSKIFIASSDLAHISFGDYVEVICPLVYNLLSRSDYYHSVNQVVVD